MTNTQSSHEQCVSTYNHFICVHDLTYFSLPFPFSLLPSLFLSCIPSSFPSFLSLSLPSSLLVNLPLIRPPTLYPCYYHSHLIFFSLPPSLSLSFHQVKCSDVLYGYTSSKLRTSCPQTTEGSLTLTLKYP